MNRTINMLSAEKFEVFSKIKREQQHRLSSISIYKNCKKGDFIYEEGHPQKSIFLLDKGTVKLGSKTLDGRELIKDIVYQSTLFGENVFVGTGKHTEYAEVMKDAGYYEIPVDYFKKLANENVAFAQTILHQMIGKLDAIEERIQNFVFKSAKDRIMYFIHKTGKLSGIKIGIDEWLINHGMSHKEIAFLTDTSRQTVARVLSELKKDNLIHFSPRKPSKILIRNIAALAV